MERRKRKINSARSCFVFFFSIDSEIAIVKNMNVRDSTIIYHMILRVKKKKKKILKTMFRNVASYLNKLREVDWCVYIEIDIETEILFTRDKNIIYYSRYFRFSNLKYEM